MLKLGPEKKRLFLLIGRVGLAAIFIFYAYARMKPLPGLRWSFASYQVSAVSFAFDVSAYKLLPDSASISLLSGFRHLRCFWVSGS
jgi:hypothetical protein